MRCSLFTQWLTFPLKPFGALWELHQLYVSEAHSDLREARVPEHPSSSSLYLKNKCKPVICRPKVSLWSWHNGIAASFALNPISLESPRTIYNLLGQMSSGHFRGAMLLVSHSCFLFFMIPMVLLPPFSWKHSLTFPDISPDDTPPCEDVWHPYLQRWLEPKTLCSSDLTSCLPAAKQSVSAWWSELVSKLTKVVGSYFGLVFKACWLYRILIKLQCKISINLTLTLTPHS